MPSRPRRSALVVRLEALLQVACRADVKLRSLILGLKDVNVEHVITLANDLEAELPLFVGIRFQVSFTPLSGCFSPFPHGTCSLSVTE